MTTASPLWAFHDAADFREAVLRAVNLGNDADTTGAVCGQFAVCRGHKEIVKEYNKRYAESIRQKKLPKATVKALTNALYDRTQRRRSQKNR
jgi:ADP-ribosylglycohydrolase